MSYSTITILIILLVGLGLLPGCTAELYSRELNQSSDHCSDSPPGVFCDPLDAPELTFAQDVAIAPPPPAEIRVESQQGGNLIGWTDPGLEIITHFVVYRASFIPFYFRPIATTTEAFFFDTNVHAKRAYSYRVSSLDRYGNLSQMSLPAVIKRD